MMIAVMGYIRFGGDIMVAMMSRNEDKSANFYDFFLSNEQAERLAKEILKQVKSNKEI